MALRRRPPTSLGARTNGAEQPPTLAVALDEGDELAKTWEMIRDLGSQLEAVKDKTKALQTELNRERRERATEDRRWGWIITANEQFTADNHRLRAEPTKPSTRPVTSRSASNKPSRRPVAPPEPPNPSTAAARPALSRAERRRLEREQHRRS
jgi:hypothetical protein